MDELAGSMRTGCLRYRPPLKQPANPRQLGPDQELSGSARLRGGGRSRYRTCLSLHFWEMQGDFDKMQGDHNRSRAKSRRISTGWMRLSLREEQGG
jgi:hypothetical protein